MWNDPVENPPKENCDVLVYTENDNMKVARICKGRWNTYLKVIGWQDLPTDAPVKKNKR